MSTLNIQLLCRKSKKINLNYRHLLPEWFGTIINPQWLEPPMSRTNFHGPKDVRAIEIRLYLVKFGTSIVRGYVIQLFKISTVMT